MLPGSENLRPKSINIFAHAVEDTIDQGARGIVGEFLRKLDRFVNTHLLGDGIGREVEHLVARDEEDDDIRSRHHRDIKLRSVAFDDREECVLARNNTFVHLVEIGMIYESEGFFVEELPRENVPIKRGSGHMSRVESLKKKSSCLLSRYVRHWDGGEGK